MTTECHPRPSQSGEKARLQGLVALIDHLLTGKPMSDTVQTAARQAHLLEPEALLTMTDAYYLSDGGYSRIVVNGETGFLRLSSVSRTEVGARWRGEDVQDAIGHVQAVLRDTLREAGVLENSSPEVEASP